jgi:hypothetical protein
MADVLRAPSYCRVTRRPFLPGFTTPNLLLSTLAVAAVVAPFVQTDWQRPQARRSVQAQVYPNLLASTLGTRPFQVSHNTQTIRRSILADQVVPNSLILGIPPPPITAPFAQSDWPSPARRGQVYVPADGSLLALGIPPPPPFVQTDWLAPQAKRPARFDTFPNLLAIFPPAVTAPFAQLDWPSPNVRARATQFATVYPNVTTRLVPPPPFKQTEWQTLKTRKFVALINDPPNLLLKTLFVPQLVLPFAQRDWPQVYRKKLRYDIAWSNYQLPPRIEIIPTITETIPYVIGMTEGPATIALLSVHMVVVVVGTGGTVVSQSPDAFTTQDRGTTVTITMGGPIYSSSRRRRASYGSPEAVSPNRGQPR